MMISVAAILLASLSLTEAVDRAFAAHPSLSLAQENAAAAHADVRREKAAFWPSLSLQASATRFEEPMIVTPLHRFDARNVPEFDETLLQWGAALRYTLFDAGERRARVRAARHGEGAATAQKSEAEQDLLFAVLGAYLECLGQRRVVDAHDRRLEALRGERARVEQLFDAGKVPRVDLLRVDASLGAAAAARATDDATLEVATHRLARRIQAPLAEMRETTLRDVSLVEGTASIDASELREKALRDHPLGRRTREESLAAEAAVPAAKSARFPELSLLAALVDRGSDDGPFTAEWNAGVALDLPLFTGGAISGAIQGAAARARRSREALRMTEQTIEEELDAALAARTEARARLESLQDAVDRFEEVARITQLLLQSGSGTQTDYLRAEADLLESRAALVRARYAELLAEARIARSTGALNRDWILHHVRSL